jgi:sec-independent protein translocase protein TatB
MLSLGWSELFIIGALALIVVGPRDLPAMLRNLGRVAGSIRRMGNEFRGELGKVAALDDIRSVRESVTNPLKKASSEIAREFNKMDGDRTVPTGAIKPAVEGAESVTDEIRAAAGLDGEKKPSKKSKAKPKPAAAKAKPAAAKAKPAAAKAKPAAAKAKPAAAKAKPAASKPKPAAAKAKPAAAKAKPATAKAKPAAAKAKPAAAKAKPAASKPTPAAAKIKPAAAKPKARRAGPAKPTRKTAEKVSD